MTIETVRDHRRDLARLGSTRAAGYRLTTGRKPSRRSLFSRRSAN